ncbi:hypothetical protein ACG7TL_006711 [Trametes sanguinea]
MPANTASPLSVQSSLPKKVSEKLLAARTNAINAGHGTCIYLGLPNVQEHLVWHRQANSWMLVTQAALQAHTKATVDYAASDADDASPPPPPEPADLAIIARISTKGTFLAPDGYYGNTTSGYSKSFDKTQLNMQLEPVTEHSLLANDYNTAIDNLNALEGLAVTTASSAKNSILLAPSPPETLTKIKIRHNVFRKKNNDDNEEEMTDDLPPECRIENWPTYSVAARRALTDLIPTHIVLPLPAYNRGNDNKIILPSQYNAKLRGSLCFVRFTLTHYTFSDEKGASGSKVKDVYVADVSSITLLHRTPSEPSTPTKCITAVDPCSPSPGNKRRRVL